MKKILSIITLLTFTLMGCEIYVIGNNSPKPIPINQSSSISSIYLFKTELDNNNIRAASQLLAQSNGNYYLAYERYELFEEINRLKRILDNKTITDYRIDTLSQTNHKVIVQFDYITEIKFLTQKINDNWFIIDYEETIHYY